MGTKIISPAGVNVDAESDTALFTLGAEARGQDGSVWVYGKAAAALSAGNVVSFSSAWAASKLTKALADTGAVVAVAQMAFTNAYYGWYLRKGCSSSYKVMVKNACAPKVALYTTGTDGALDDTSASQTLVYGIQILGTSTGSLATNKGGCLAIEIWTPATP